MKNITIPRSEQLNSCPVCHSKNIRFWSEAQDLLTQSSPQIFKYSKCLDCACLFMSTRPVEEDVSFFYSSEYHPYQSHLNPSTQVDERGCGNFYNRVRRFAVRALKKLLKTIKPKSDISPLTKAVSVFYKNKGQKQVFVDFGCGAGKTLNQMQTGGWKTVGVDFSPFAIQSVIENKHEGYLVDDFWKFYKDESVDLVRMNHVVEHLYHPKELINKLALKMKQGSRLHIAVPNPAGISAILFRKNWHGLDCPRHVILYPPQTLINLLEQAGFHKFEVIQESISKDLIRSIGYFLAKLGLIKLNNVNNLMYSKTLSLIFRLPTKVAAFIGKGDRFHIFCIKQ